MSKKMWIIFLAYIAQRFPDIEENDTYFNGWRKRFENGWEWQQSDFEGRRVLKTLATEIYPDDKNKFFRRTEF